MNCVSASEKQQEFMTKILAFLESAKGLKGERTDQGLRIKQTVDGKALEIAAWDLEDILLRSDTEGQEFIQVNFATGAKILITANLIGFKPTPLKGLDLTKLPRVVTTPDIMSIFEAIQDTLDAQESEQQEFGTLKKVYEAVLTGGEAVGFDLSAERAWISRVSNHSSKLAS